MTQFTLSPGDELTYETDETGSTGGWKMEQFLRELASSNSTSISLTEFIEIVDEVTDVDYHLAVYMYDMEKNPVACATLKLVTDEKAAEYEELLADLNKGGEVSDAATTTTLGAAESESPSSGGLPLISACVIGMSMLMSAILVSM